jgi:4-amino-4-deoxy-L-arabinose transferase-like glycosyltransferase
MLTKQYYFVFIVGPAIFLLFDSLSNKSSRMKVILNFSFALLLGAAIAALWYIPNFSHMFPLLISAVNDPSLVPFDSSSLAFRNIFFYFNLIFNEQILLFFFLIFIFSVFIFCRKIGRRYLFLFLSCFIIPYIIFTLFPNKFYYYTLPYLPVIALITAYGLLNIQKTFFRKIVIWFVVSVGLFQFIVISYFNFKENKLALSLRNPYVRILPINLSTLQARKTYCPQASRKAWVVMEKIVTKINSSFSGEVAKILILQPDANYLAKNEIKVKDNFDVVNYGGFKGYSYLIGANYDIYNTCFYNEETIEDWFNFIISPEKLENIKIFASKEVDYILLDNFVMQDGSEVYLYVGAAR